MVALERREPDFRTGLRRLLVAPRYKRVYVMSPAHATTGGPEALHQLVDALRRRGHEAFISYHLDPDAPVPAEYRGYDVVRAAPADEPGNLVVIPEVITPLIRDFRQAATAIWWLSVDNFFGSRPEDDGAFARLQREHERKLRAGEPTGRASWDELRAVHNFSQSTYATRFLAGHDIIAQPLGDYIHPDIAAPDASAPRQDVIAFNPKKGLAAIERLQRAHPSLQWLPLAGMSRAAIAAALREVKLYADFGFHPGRDRIPREAALAGACVVTGRRGSASIEADLPIPSQYKLDESRPDFETGFGLLAMMIFSDFAAHRASLRPFVRIVQRQKSGFEAQVRAIFERRRLGARASFPSWSRDRS